MLPDETTLYPHAQHFSEKQAINVMYIIFKDSKKEHTHHISLDEEK
jgi:hypothetical protein